MNAEQVIKNALDGWLFRITTTSGPEARPIVRAIKVPRDYIPSHKADWDYAVEPSSQPHHNAVAFTPEQDDIIITMREQKHRWQEIAKTIHRCMNRTRDRYKELCMERGVDPVKRIDRGLPPQRLSDAVKAQIWHMREAGLSYDKIAAQMGLTRWTVSDCIGKMRKNRQRRMAA